MSQRPRSQGRPSQGVGRQNQAPPEEVVIAACRKAVHFLLAHSGSRNAPVKHLDLKKFAFPDFPRVEEPMRLSFGYDLQIQEVNKNKVYYLTNNFLNEGHIILPKYTEGYRTLLSLILAFIFMSRGPVEQKNLLKFLRQMGVDIDRPHPFFGDVADLYYKPNPTFVKDQFLTVAETERGIFYEWGPRAKVEVDPKAVLQLVCEILGSDINSWKMHLKDCESMVGTEE